MNPSSALIAAIRNSPLPPYRIAEAAGVTPGNLYRFLNHERTMNLDTFDKLAAVLGLHVVRDETPCSLVSNECTQVGSIVPACSSVISEQDEIGEQIESQEDTIDRESFPSTPEDLAWWAMA